MNAAYNGQTATVLILLAAGANIEAKTEAGCTALAGAARNGHDETVRVLLDAGADPEIVTNDGKTALDLAVLFERDTVAAMLRGYTKDACGLGAYEA